MHQQSVESFLLFTQSTWVFVGQSHGVTKGQDFSRGQHSMKIDTSAA